MELGGAEPHTTNNAMEMRGVLEFLRFVADQPGVLELYVDSSYVIQGITQWVHQWEKRGWKTVQGTPVLNEALWRALKAEVEKRAKRGLGPIQWRQIKGHAGLAGNERADTIAVAFSLGKKPALYQGPEAGYAFKRAQATALLPGARPSQGKKKSDSASRAHSKAKALFYVSFVEGELKRHDTWAECESRVKGVSGARFKKVTKPEEEAQIVAEWRSAKGPKRGWDEGD